MKRTLFKKLSLGMLFSGFLCLGVAGVVGHHRTAQPVFATTPDVIIDSDQDMMDLIDACNAGVTYEGQVVRLDADISVTLTKAPTYDSTNKIYSFFNGEFDGNNHTINVTINTSDGSTGIWRNINGTVHDLNLAGEIVNSGAWAEPLCVYNNGTIRNVHSSVVCNMATPVNYVCGILGVNQNGGSVVDCSFSGSLKGAQGVAGIAGKCYKGTISGCVNYGSISATNYYAGGILAVLGGDSFTEGIIENCINYGAISSTSKDLGGIAGFMYSNNKVRYCSNYGAITSTSTLSSDASYGGIIGRMRNKDETEGHSTKIEYCYNGGDVTCNYIGGGLIGMIQSNVLPIVEINGCFVTGNVNVSLAGGKGYGGTLIGWANSSNTSISNTYCAGAILGEGFVGVGGGTAKSTATSIASGVSSDFKEVVKFIREYTCSQDATIFKAKFHGLSADEESLLSQVIYYDELTGFDPKVHDQTYLQAGAYIAGDPYVGANPAHNVFGINKQTNTWLILIITSVLSISTLTAFIVIKRKRSC